MKNRVKLYWGIQTNLNTLGKNCVPWWESQYGKLSVPPQLIGRVKTMTIRVTILTGKEKVSSYSKIYWKKEMGSNCQGKLEDKRVILNCTDYQI